MRKVLAVCGSAGHWRSGESQPYVDAARAAGIEPVVISPGDPVPHGWSGLLLFGGSDVNPARYGEAPHEKTDSPDDARDELECKLIADSLEHDLPILAICRGAQILNVKLGGSLKQHLDSTARHQQRPTDKSQPAHQAEIAPGTLLAEIEGGPLTITVNSRHHQAVARPGEGLRISAHDPEDNTIEAVELPGKRFVLGVQWHPENMYASDPRQARLFEAFAAALKSA